MLKKLIVLALMVSGLAFTQAPPDEPAARQYYDELRAVSGINPLMTSVCFRPGEPEVFEVIGFSRDFAETMKAKGKQLDPALKNSAKDNLLISQTYKRGVKTGENLLSKDKGESDSWFQEYTSKGHKFRLVISISPAGRYRRAVYVDNKITATAEGYGKCEPIQ